MWTRRVPSLFLDTFGRPDLNQDPPCERTSETTVVQVLHLMNSPALHDKITSEEGRAARLARGTAPPREIVDELYLLAYSRLPADDERAAAVSVFEGPKASRRQGVEDVLWALMNSAEFLFKD